MKFPDSKKISYEYGRHAEDKACTYLIQNDLFLLEKNYRTKNGEIDLIMRDNDILVFIEVRARKNNRFLEPIETISKTKQRNIISTSQHYIQNNHHKNIKGFRFDVILMSGSIDNANIDWVKSAFEVN